MKTDTIKGPLTETWGILKADISNMVKGVLWIQLMSLFAVLITLMLALGAGYALFGISPWAAIALGSVIFICGVYCAGVLNSMNYNFIEAAVNKKKIAYSETARGNALPFLGFVAGSALINLILLGPFFVIFIYVIFTSYTSTTDSTGLAMMFAQLVFRLVIVVIGSIIALFTQFAIFEIILGHRGIIEGFRKSAYMVKKNFWESVIFSFAIWAVGAVVSIPIVVVIVILAFGGLIGTVALGSMAILLWIAIGIVILLLAVLSSALTSTIAITARYRYWMRVKKSF